MLGKLKEHIRDEIRAFDKHLLQNMARMYCVPGRPLTRCKVLEVKNMY
jgi:hypothetical protein